MSVVYLESVGVFAAGLEGWDAARRVLAGEAAYQSVSLPKYKPALLPANERRRATGLVRLAFGACEDAVGERLEEAAGLAAVFAASGGDYLINDQICRTVAGAEPMVSPTQFHNSVHNAAAGYWSIATGSKAPSVSLSAYDYTVGAGLIEALTLVAVERLPTLLALYDNTVDWPMKGKRLVRDPFAAAFWLSPESSPYSLAKLELHLQESPCEQLPLVDAQLESLRLGNPAARSLPLLQLLATRCAGTVQFETGGRLSGALKVQPC